MQPEDERIVNFTSSGAMEIWKRLMLLPNPKYVALSETDTLRCLRRQLRDD